MARPTRWALVYGLLGATCVLVVACATGGSSAGDGDDAGGMMNEDAGVTPPQDSSTSMLPDAPKPKLDAGTVPTADAFVPPPDAPPNSVFCSSNAQCTVAGECCVTLGGTMGFCAPGTVVFGQCFPQ